MTEQNETLILYKLEELKTDLASVRAQVDELDASVRGNGAPGLRQRIGNLELKMKIVAWVGTLVGGAAILGATHAILRVMGQ